LSQRVDARRRSEGRIHPARTARQRGYRRITLWTHRVLTTARQVYERAGFRLTSSQARHSWGVVSEHWDMTLAG